MYELIFSQMNVSAEVLHYSQDYLGHYFLFTIPILLMNNFPLSDRFWKIIRFFLSALWQEGSLILFWITCLLKLWVWEQQSAVATGLGYSVTAVVGFVISATKRTFCTLPSPVFVLMF